MILPRRFPFLHVLAFILSLTSSAQARTIECSGLLLCSFDDAAGNKKEFCCPTDTTCTPDRCEPTTNPCAATGKCTAECTSNFDCNGQVCIFTFEGDSSTGLGQCAPPITDEEPPEFKCMHAPTDGPPNPCAMAMIMAWSAYLARRRRRSAA